MPAFGLAALSVVALVTGCAPQAEPTPTPTPRFTSQAQAYQAAEATYRAYVDALNKVDLRDPATFEDVYKWETGEALNSEKKSLTKMHADGWTLTGDSVLTLIQASRSVPYSPNSIAMDACVDVSTVDLLGKDGKSMVAPDRGDMQTIVVTFAAANSNTGWLVSFVDGRDSGPSCE
nr:hypothetical protein [Microbacterium sp. SYP-A9085]